MGEENEVKLDVKTDLEKYVRPGRKIGYTLLIIFLEILVINS